MRAPAPNRRSRNSWDDPITQTLIASDRVRPDDVGTLVEATRRRLLARGSQPTPHTKER